jgi:hypothetical protein
MPVTQWFLEYFLRMNFCSVSPLLDSGIANWCLAAPFYPSGVMSSEGFTVNEPYTNLQLSRARRDFLHFVTARPRPFIGSGSFPHSLLRIGVLCGTD